MQTTNLLKELETSYSLPLIAFILPTYQAEEYIRQCLESIYMQEYPREKIEVFVIDGGSTDRTLEIAQEYPVTILQNEKRVAEYAKLIGIHATKAQYFILIDADNEIVETTWLIDMVRPVLEDPTIFGVESRFAADKKMHSIDRCFARMRIADPMARFLRSRYIKGIPHYRYMTLELKKHHILITGANGFLWKKDVILPLIEGKEKFEETNMSNVVFQATGLSYAVPRNAGIRHYYCASFLEFCKKRKKIAKKMGMRMETQQSDTWIKKVPFIYIILGTIYYLTILGPLLIATKNSIRDKTLDWFWYPLIGFATVSIYFFYLFDKTITFYFKKYFR